MQQLPLSVILITKNEEANIEFCLKSLSSFSEVILVDSGSTDKTLELAGYFPNVRIFQESWHGFCENKQIAINHASHSWILWIDADEEVSIELKNEISDLFSSKESLSKNSAFFIPRQNYFLGYPVRYGGWSNTSVIRLFHKEKAYLDGKKLHEGIVTAGVVSVLNGILRHYTYISLEQFFQKMLNYGEQGAQVLLKKKKPVYPFILILNPIWTFIRFYFFKRGFLDGVPGIVIAVGSAFSNFIKYSYFIYSKKFGFTKNYKREIH